MDFSALGVLLKLPFADTMFILSLKESIVECYGVSAKYSNVKNCRGIRAAVYKYNDESTDLNIALWFEEKTKANEFFILLSTWHQKNPIVVKSGDVTVEEKKQCWWRKKNFLL